VFVVIHSLDELLTAASAKFEITAERIFIPQGGEIDDIKLIRIFTEPEDAEHAMQPSRRDYQGAYLIDRSPTYFEPLLNYFKHDLGGLSANMEGINLKGADLEGSNMAAVNLRVVTLKNANLRNCDLRSAVLAGTDLEVPIILFYTCCLASFSVDNLLFLMFSDLSGFDLQDANLRGANLKDAAFELMLTPLHMSQTIR
ncbi:BTB/POZ domain-containing protein KCTD9, partial [Harpegnathos saltator]